MEARKMDVYNNTPVYRKSGDASQYLWYGIFILWGLFMMDVITTEVILSFGGYEMNSLMRMVVSSVPLHAALKMAVLSLIAVVAYVSNRITKRSGTVAVTVIIIWYTFVIVHNVTQMLLIIP